MTLSNTPLTKSTFELPTTEPYLLPIPLTLSPARNQTNFVIPKLIHRVWITFDPKNPNIPERYIKSDRILKSLHHDWEFIEWNEKQIIALISAEYPEFLALYLSYDAPVKRHDLSRYLILDKFGGLFVQHSFVAQKKFDPLIEGSELVFSTKMSLPKRKDELSNGFMASVPSHPFWKFLFDKLLKSGHIANVMDATGPFILTKAFKEYQTKNNDTSIKILEHPLLFPFYFFDKNNTEIKENCIEHDDLMQCFKLFPNSYAYCPWTSSWTNSTSQKAQVNLELLNISKGNIRIFVPNLARSPNRWNKFSQSFKLLGLEAERFEAVDGYTVEITDPETNKTHKGLDIKRKVINLPIGKDFYINCNNKIDDPIIVTLRGYKVRLMAGNIGVWCTKLLIRKRIIEDRISDAIVFEDDFKPNPDNFFQHMSNFLNSLPEYHVAYLHNHVKNRETLVETNNSLILAPSKSTEWYGDWAYAISYEGAVALNRGYRFVGNSDDYTKTLAKSNITVYFARHNFSAVDSTYYSGHSNDSISTKMGCRDSHPSDPKDCNFNQVMPDKIYVIHMPEEAERAEFITEDFRHHNLSFSFFKAVNGLDEVRVTDFRSNQTFYGRDIKSKKAKIGINLKYEITCNPGSTNETSFNFTGYVTNEGNLVDAGALGLWCSNIMIWEDAQRNGYNRIMVLEDDIKLASNFSEALNTTSLKVPRSFDILYLDFKLFTSKNTLRFINEYINGFHHNASGSRAHAIIFSANGIDKLLSLRNSGYKYPIDHFYWCLNTGRMKVFNYHPDYECKQHANFLETYTSSNPLVTLNSLSQHSLLDRMGRSNKPNVYFDNAIVISLDPFLLFSQRYIPLRDALNSIGFPHNRSNATNGYKVLVENPITGQMFKGIDLKNNIISMSRNITYNIRCDSEQVDFTLTGRKFNAGEIGIWCSHFRAWKQAYEKQASKTLVFEDDFFPVNLDTFIEDINTFLKILDTLDNFHIGYLYSIISNGTKIPLPGNLSHISTISSETSHYSAMAYCFSYKFAEKMLKDPHFYGSVDQQLNLYSSSNIYFSTEDFYNATLSNIPSIASKMGCREAHPNSCSSLGNNSFLEISEVSIL